MSKLLRFPGTRKITEQASLWLVSIDEGLTDDERRALEKWLADDPRHGQALVRLANVWGAFDALSELAEIFPLDQYRAQRSRVPLLKVGAAAATLAAMAVLGGYIVSMSPETGGPDPISVALPESRGGGSQTAAPDRAAASRSYETAIGEQLSARLPDGSVVTLNTNTLLNVDYSGSERVVTIMRGEASFNVQRDASRPFRVLARSAVVQALGTVFNVQLDSGDRIEVTVSEGQVRVTMPPDEQPPAGESASETRSVSLPRGIDVTVGAGELATIEGPQEAVRRIDPVEIEAQLAWQRGMLIFRGAPLETVLADFSRYTTLEFTIADESIRARRVGGYFRSGDVDSLLVALRESFDIEPRRVGDEIILTARD